jgi:phage baseplate assembly protein W
MLLTEPTELYNAPTFGVGLKRYLFQYNNENTRAMIEDRIKEQLQLYEPCCDAYATVFTDGLMFSGSDANDPQHFNKLEMSVGLKTIFGDVASVNLSDLQTFINTANGEI